MRILIAEDEADIAIPYKIALEKRHHEVVLTNSGEDCIEAYHKALKLTKSGTKDSSFDVVILDYRMPKKDGIEVAKEILSINTQQRIILASAYVKDSIANSVKEIKRIVEVLQKPFALDVLIDIVEDKQIHKELQKLNAKVHNIADIDPTNKQMSDIFEELRKIQKCDVWYAVGGNILA
jgi:DNA-binding NtrC family response regulator